MDLSPIYPATRHEVPPPADLSDRAERERLGGDAARAFINMMARWKIRDADARRLLGGMSNGAYYALKKRPDRMLDEDRIRRVSYLVGIFGALNALYGEKLADRWMTLPNGNRIFGGLTPVDYLVRGGMPAFATVRRLLDARRSGY